MKKIVFASHNLNKVKEVQEIVSPLEYEIISLKDLSLDLKEKEDAPTFEGNARIKALEIVDKVSLPVLSDDSGLCIDALDGFPGIHSARFMEGCSYKEKCIALLNLLKGELNREAFFISAMVYIDKEKGIEKTFVGKDYGKITEVYDDNAINGFGYDPIFYSYKLKMTYGQAKASEKDKVSHRGKALKQVFDFLKELN